MDACVDTPKGSEVDQHGCPEDVKEIIFLARDILFGIDKDQVTTFHYSELKKAAEFVDKYPMSQVVVEDHADDRGSEMYNRLLSQRPVRIKFVLADALRCMTGSTRRLLWQKISG